MLGYAGHLDLRPLILYFLPISADFYTTNTFVCRRHRLTHATLAPKTDSQNEKRETKQNKQQERKHLNRICSYSNQILPIIGIHYEKCQQIAIEAITSQFLKGFRLTLGCFSFASSCTLRRTL